MTRPCGCTHCRIYGNHLPTDAPAALRVMAEDLARAILGLPPRIEPPPPKEGPLSVEERKEILASLISRAHTKPGFRNERARLNRAIRRYEATLRSIEAIVCRAPGHPETPAADRPHE